MEDLCEVKMEDIKELKIPQKEQQKLCMRENMYLPTPEKRKITASDWFREKLTPPEKVVLKTNVLLLLLLNVMIVMIEPEEVEWEFRFLKGEDVLHFFGLLVEPPKIGGSIFGSFCKFLTGIITAMGLHCTLFSTFQNKSCLLTIVGWALCTTFTILCNIVGILIELYQNKAAWLDLLVVLGHCLLLMTLEVKLNWATVKYFEFVTSCAAKSKFTKRARHQRIF